MQKRDSQTTVVAGALCFYVQVITSGRLFFWKEQYKGKKKKRKQIQAHWESRENGNGMTIDEKMMKVLDSFRICCWVGNSLLRLAKYPCVRRIL
jgi:hypothetical protein